MREHLLSNRERVGGYGGDRVCALYYEKQRMWKFSTQASSAAPYDLSHMADPLPLRPASGLLLFTLHTWTVCLVAIALEASWMRSAA